MLCFGLLNAKYEVVNNNNNVRVGIKDPSATQYAD